MQCDFGKVYLACGSPYPQTCGNLDWDAEDADDTTPCVEGCFCPAGFVEDGKTALGDTLLTKLVYIFF